MRFALLALWSLVIVGPGELQAQGVTSLGRCPLDDVISVSAGRFSSNDTDELLVVQSIGDVEMSRSAGEDRARVKLQRLALVRLSATGPHVAWTSETFAGSSATELDLAGTVWAVGDVDANGRSELLLFSAGRCRIISFAGDSAATDTVAFADATVEAACIADVNNDATADVVALERVGTTRLLRVYQLAASKLAPHQPYAFGLDWGRETRVALLGAARLDDYPGLLPVVAGIRSDLRPSIYAILYEPSADSTVFTASPFPWQEWFSKVTVLPAGELSLFNVGDTLAAYGYFVPGSRSSGSSFAALQDGEWRLLPFTDAAARLTGPVCRFVHHGVAGWLELRDNQLSFYQGDVFRWR